MTDGVARARKSPVPSAAELRERLRVALITGMGELDLSHADVADACSTTRQSVSLWASPHHEDSISLAYSGVLAANADERLRTLGLRLLRVVLASAEADVVDLRLAEEQDPLVAAVEMDREDYEARASVMLADADGVRTAPELKLIIKENDEAAAVHARQANLARAQLEKLMRR